MSKQSIKEIITNSCDEIVIQLQRSSWNNKLFYIQWLAQTTYFVRHSTRLLTLCAAHCDDKQMHLHHRFISHAAEEKGHEKLSLMGLHHLGVKIDDIQENNATMYFNNLRALWVILENIIPFGRSLFGTINRWIIRHLFDFLASFIGSKGIVILILTLIVKLLLYPFSYKTLAFQAKMSALKPQMAVIREKYKDDQQTQQMETMKLYREFGVNPLGGCLPTLLQMPIWFALYRFFPASIEFRQASFLWAHDLSSFDVFFRLPFELPFGIGCHISLLTLLWSASTLGYPYY